MVPSVVTIAAPLQLQLREDCQLQFSVSSTQLLPLPAKIVTTIVYKFGY